MTGKHKKLEFDAQPAYDPPQALRLGDTHTGAGGVLCDTGSGDEVECTAGFSASTCNVTGNTAGVCFQAGSGPAVLTPIP